EVRFIGAAGFQHGHMALSFLVTDMCRPCIQDDRRTRNRRPPGYLMIRCRPDIQRFTRGGRARSAHVPHLCRLIVDKAPSANPVTSEIPLSRAAPHVGRLSTKNETRLRTLSSND